MARASRRLRAARVHGNSMRPVLLPGMWVVLGRGGRLRSGDIIAARVRRQVLLHRYLREEGGRLVMRGDWSFREDPPVTPADVVGCVRAVHVPGRGWCRPWAPGRWLHLALRRALGRPLPSPLHPAIRFLYWRPILKGHPTPPMARSDLELQEIGRELVVHDPVAGDVHVLNETAAVIFRAACEGRGNEAIADDLVKRFPDVSREQLLSDVEKTLEQLRAGKLL